MLCTLTFLGCSYQSIEAHPARRPGIATVAEDNNGNPVKIAYVTQGHNDGRPTIVFADQYFGINGWRCLQEKFSDDFYTIAFDPVGFGLSTKNDPALMDGVVGQTGYSFRQYAILTHQLLVELNAHGPVIWVGVDPQGNVGMWYATEYAADDLALSKLVMVNSAPNGQTSDDPCRLAFLSTSTAAGLSTFFAADPCFALCTLLANSFATTDCPEASTIQLNAAVKYIATLPPAVFARLFTQTFTEDLAPMMQTILIPTLHFYGTTSDINPVSRKATGIAFMGFCPSCPDNNPLIPGTCSCGPTSIVPFPDVRLLVYPGHGTCLHVSASKRFAKDVMKFILGKDSRCTLCPTDFDSPGTCPDCS